MLEMQNIYFNFNEHFHCHFLTFNISFENKWNYKISFQLKTKQKIQQRRCGKNILPKKHLKNANIKQTFTTPPFSTCKSNWKKKFENKKTQCKITNINKGKIISKHQKITCNSNYLSWLTTGHLGATEKVLQCETHKKLDETIVV